MPTPPPAARATVPLPRPRTVAGGTALAGVLLLGLTLAGGATVPNAIPDPPEGGERVGPLTAIQPELRQALLSEREPPAAATTPPDPPRAEPPASPASTAAPEPEQPTPSRPIILGNEHLCRTLFEDPASLAELWGAEPLEISTSDKHRGSGVLHHVFTLLDGEQAPSTYARLRDAAAECHRFTAALASGEVVTVLLEELTWDQRESARADEAYAVRITLEDASQPLSGWLAIDRVGPAVSVLRHLEPGGQGGRQEAAFAAGSRSAALSKLRALLRALGDRTGAAAPASGTR